MKRIAETLLTAVAYFILWGVPQTDRTRFQNMAIMGFSFVVSGVFSFSVATVLAFAMGIA